MSAELSQLIELQELDLEIKRVADRLQTIPVERERIETEFRNNAAEFLSLKNRHQQISDDRKQLEADLAQAQQQYEKFEQDKMKVRNEKEYTTALRELDATRKQISGYETEIIRCMEELEKLEAEMNTRAPDVERQRQEVDQRLTELEAERQRLTEMASALNERRAALTATVPKRLLETYDRVARRGRGQALSPAQNGICGACRMRIRPKVFSDVRRGEDMITCEHCGRILYYRAEGAQPTEAAATQQAGPDQ